MNSSDTWPTVEEKMQELRSLTKEQWKTGGWELAALGDRVLGTAEKSKLGAGRLMSNKRALKAATKSFVQIARDKIKRLDSDSQA